MKPDTAAQARELFIYWRCGHGQTEAAIEALASFQRGLAGEFPGLMARRYLRTEADQPHATVMESYARPGQGLDAALEELLLSRSALALDPWCQGQRHVEVFQELDP